MDSTETVAHDTRTERERNLDGVQALLDLLRRHPELESPFTSRIHMPISSYGRSTDEIKSDLAAWARALSHLRPGKSYEDGWASLTAYFEDVELFVYTNRENVCERVVRGTRQVTETVKDPDMLAAVPEVEVTREVEDVEWICRPLLADEQASA